MFFRSFRFGILEGKCGDVDREGAKDGLKHIWRSVVVTTWCTIDSKLLRKKNSEVKETVNGQMMRKL